MNCKSFMKRKFIFKYPIGKQNNKSKQVMS